MSHMLASCCSICKLCNFPYTELCRVQWKLKLNCLILIHADLWFSYGPKIQAEIHFEVHWNAKIRFCTLLNIKLPNVFDKHMEPNQT